jgi:hypothetical protein
MRRRVALGGARLLRGRLRAGPGVLLLLTLIRAFSHIVHPTLHIPELIPHLAGGPDDGQ